MSLGSVKVSYIFQLTTALFELTSLNLTNILDVIAERPIERSFLPSNTVIHFTSAQG